MQLTVTEMVDSDGNRWYEWQMYDGPDGIDDSSGRANTLGECFEKVVHNRTITAISYSSDEKDYELCDKIYRVVSNGID
jgi:hypothetical protein